MVILNYAIVATVTYPSLVLMIPSPTVKIPSLVRVSVHLPNLTHHLYLIVARDQEVDIPTQLDLGVRLLQAQAHLGDDGVIHFCHTSTSHESIITHLTFISLCASIPIPDLSH